MVRVPKSTLTKDLISFKSARCKEQWESARLAIAQCGAALAGDMPVFWQFYSMLGLGLEGRRPDWGNDLPGMFYLSLGMEAKCSPPLPETRLSFYLAFDITPDEQVALEQLYTSVRIEWDGAGMAAPVQVLTHHPALQQLTGCW
jgi:hypothetical protein